MNFWQTIATMFVGAAITIPLNYLVTMTIFRKQKQEAVPTDFAVFKAQTERMIAERENEHKDLALALVQTQRDLIGVRETVQWIKGRINGSGWKQGG